MNKANSWTDGRPRRDQWTAWAVTAGGWAVAGMAGMGVARVWVFSRYHYAGSYYLYALIATAVAAACGSGAMALLPTRFGHGRAYLAGMLVPAAVIAAASLFIARDFSYGGAFAYTASLVAWAAATLATWLFGGIIRWLRSL